MRIGHCQFESGPGDFDGNLDKVVKGLERADRERVEIVCFPECFLTGYEDTEEAVRKSAFAADSPRMMKLLDRTRRFSATCIVGYNEVRGKDLYNTAVVLHKGHVLGREFPVFERDGVKFGIVICSDGGYIEPARILAIKGARIIFSPHYNYINKEYLLKHFVEVRGDHVARAVENRIWFVRGNNVCSGKDPAIKGFDGVGYGDSYIVDPYGEILVRSRRHQEDFIFADVDPTTAKDTGWNIGRSRWSVREFGKMLLDAAQQAGDGK
jgi:predicted amidohydrolase